MDARYNEEKTYFGSRHIFGSAAPALERPEPKAEPEVKRIPLERVSLRADAQEKPLARQGISLFALAGWACIAILAVLLIMSYTELNTISDQTHTLTEQMDELKLQETRLKIDYESTFKLDEVEEYASNMLGMVKAESGQVKYLNDRAGDQAVMISDGGSGGGLMAKLKSLLTSVSEYFR